MPGLAGRPRPAARQREVGGEERAPCRRGDDHSAQLGRAFADLGGAGFGPAAGGTGRGTGEDGQGGDDPEGERARLAAAGQGPGDGGLQVVALGPDPQLPLPGNCPARARLSTPRCMRRFARRGQDSHPADRPRRVPGTAIVLPSVWHLMKPLFLEASRLGIFAVSGAPTPRAGLAISACARCWIGAAAFRRLAGLGADCGSGPAPRW